MDVAIEPTYSGSTAGYVQSVSLQKSKSEIIQGSGSIYNFEEFYSKRSGQIEPVIIKVSIASSRIARIQDEILEIFDLGMGELADACQVTRKTPYNWRNTKREINRRKKGMDRLFLLFEAARNWRNAGYVKPSDFLREPLVNGKSLFDLLLAETIDQESIQSLGARLTMRRLDSFDISNPFA